MPAKDLAKVSVELFGLIAVQSVTPHPNALTRVLLLKGGDPEHLPCLSVPISDVEKMEGYKGSVFPRAASIGGTDSLILSLKDSQLTLQSDDQFAHDLDNLLSLYAMYTLGGGLPADYGVNLEADEIASIVTLSGGAIETKDQPPLDTRPVVYTSNHEDPKATKGKPVFADNIVTWEGRVPFVLEVRGIDGRQVTPWRLHLTRSARLCIYSLPSSVEPVDTTLEHFLTIFKLLKAQPAVRFYPKVQRAGGPAYDDFPRCIPPALV